MVNEQDREDLEKLERYLKDSKIPLYADRGRYSRAIILLNYLAMLHGWDPTCIIFNRLNPYTTSPNHSYLDLMDNFSNHDFMKALFHVPPESEMECRACGTRVGDGTPSVAPSGICGRCGLDLRIVLPVPRWKRLMSEIVLLQDNHKMLAALQAARECNCQAFGIKQPNWLEKLFDEITLEPIL